MFFGKGLKPTFHHSDVFKTHLFPILVLSSPAFWAGEISVTPGELLPFCRDSGHWEMDGLHFSPLGSKTLGRKLAEHMRGWKKLEAAWEVGGKELGLEDVFVSFTVLLVGYV